MESPPNPLTPSEHRRLVSIIQREAPTLRALAQDVVNARWLTDEEAAALSRVLLDVFLRSLGDDDEPDRDGVEADSLLGQIEMQREGYWRSS